MTVSRCRCSSNAETTAAGLPGRPASADGTDHRQQLFAPCDDLLGENSLHHTARPQCTAVVKAHLESASLVERNNDSIENPRRMLATITLDSLEPHMMFGTVVNGADHSKPFRPGERPQSSTQLDPPGHPIIVGPFGIHLVDQGHPCRVLVETVDQLEQRRRAAWGIERSRHIHGRPDPMTSVTGLRGVTTGERTRQQRTTSIEEAVEVIRGFEPWDPGGGVGLGSIVDIDTLS